MRATDSSRAGRASRYCTPGRSTISALPRTTAPSSSSLSLGTRSVLLTGDIEAAAEADLVAGGSRLSADVLKVAHHGSRTSTTQAFLEKVSPRLALVGVGRRNRFGHPGRGVITRITPAGAAVFRTDRHGDVALLFREGHIFPSRPFAGLPGGLPLARRRGVLAVVGATATGKSALAVDVALRLGGEVISADAFTAYRGIDAGTAKPTVEERRGVPHHLVDIKDPSDPLQRR